MFKIFNTHLDRGQFLLYNVFNIYERGDYMRLGDYIKQYRTSHGLSQRQFASECGLSYGYISMLEKGVNTSTGTPIVPTLQTMRSLAKAMGTSIHKIAEEVDDLYMDLTGEEKPLPLFQDLLVHGQEKQPSVSEGLSQEEQALLTAFRALTPDQQAFVLRQLSAAQPAPAIPDSAESSQ